VSSFQFAALRESISDRRELAVRLKTIFTIREHPLIERIILRNFKSFREQVFELQDHVVLAGPNNSGKSTLLQAIAVWNLALRKWLEKRGKSSARQRTGVGITRRDFTAIPLREMNLLWTDTSTSLRQEEAEAAGHRQGYPRSMSIELQCRDASGPWSLGFDFHYQNAEMISVKPMAGHLNLISDFVPKTAESESEQAPSPLRKFNVVHVPAFSGIGAEETVLTRDYQDYLVGQGKPGDIVRNLLKEVFEKDKERWNNLVKDIRTIFTYELLPPEFEGRPFIVCEYLKQVPSNGKRSGIPRLDIATAGSGFHQVLMLLAFLYARDGSVLLLDEPDAHLHVILQDQIYMRLRKVAAERQSQLIVASHSEVIISGTSPANVTSFYRKPHVLVADVEREQVREALKRLTSLDLLLADSAKGFLYLEGETDFRLLKAWATVLEHPVANWFNAGQSGPAWQDMRGRNPREAKAHFFALKAIRPDIKGLILLDGDNRAPERELRSDGLRVHTWPRYEAESYLLHPATLERFIVNRTKANGDPAIFGVGDANKGLKYLRDQLPPVFFTNVFENSLFLISEPASKTLLPGFFAAIGMATFRKTDYFLVAEQMQPDEIHPDVIAVLDQIAEALMANEGIEDH
jgi:predicted ATPase